MHIETRLNNQRKLPYRVELLKSLDFVDSVEIQANNTDADRPATKPSVFGRFYGSTISGLTMDQFS